VWREENRRVVMSTKIKKEIKKFFNEEEQKPIL
jgi:hypothetical protein